MSAKLQTTKAMILARGLGTRMQKDVDGLALDDATARIADQGGKGMIPIGRPFLDHTLQALMDAGLKDFCLIVPPGASAIRQYYEAVSGRLDDGRISFAVQEQPLGTAHAVLPGKDWAAGEPFCVFNSDNYYYPTAVRALASANPPGSIAFERDALIAGSNIPAERITRFAAMDIDDEGNILRIIEKPENPEQYARDGKLYVSMNCFLFTEAIFTACASIDMNPQRNEYELPTAVQYSIDKLGQTYQAVRVAEGVLDLTGRADIEPVRRMLAGHEVRFWAPEQLET